MPSTTGPIQAPGRVLSTLNVDGTRRWIRPRPSTGRWQHARRLTAYVLMVIFMVVPLVRIGGEPLVLLDLPHRQFTLFGTRFLSTDTVFFMLLFLGSAIGIFLVTAVLGRVWCGWACPQTVYMEFLFRPVERLLERGWLGSRRTDRERGVMHPRRIVKNVIYLVFALVLAHTFLAYFVPWEELSHWLLRSPVRHSTSFFLMMVTTGLIFFDFAYFREQACLVACPYGRLQSVLLDRRSLIVGYDARRGEPRGKGVRERAAGLGDCIDCRMCVQTCPTGIDIREGLQMECVHCTQCIDACDRVMVQVGKPVGLIRYGSRDGFEGGPKQAVRPRVVFYPVALTLVLGVFLVLLVTRRDTDITVLSGVGMPYTVESGANVMNQLRVKLVNRAGHDRTYHIALDGAPDAQLIVPIDPQPVAAFGMATALVIVLSSPEAFHDGSRGVTLRITDGARFDQRVSYVLAGPRPGEGHERDEPVPSEPHETGGEHR
jgi:cytochrome c oxidase accessory protein FixG